MAGNIKELHSDLERTSLYYQNYNLLFLSQVFISESHYGLYKRLTLMNIIKRLSLDNLVKYFSFKFTNLFLKKRVRLHFDFLFINDVNNGPVVQMLLAAHQHFPQETTGIVYFDNRLGRPKDHVLNAFEFINLKMFWVSTIEIVKALPTLFKGWSEIADISRKYGTNRLLLLINCLDTIFSINVVRFFLNKVSAQKVILMTDVHKLSRIITLMSKEKKSTTFIIQHGATVGEEGYLPITADKMLAWGESSRRWFITNGQLEEKIVVTGTPKVDDRKYLPPANLESREIRKALVVVSTITLEMDFLQTIRDAFIKEPFTNVEISIKLHPGTKLDYSYIVDEIFKDCSLAYKVFTRENLIPLLTDTDIVLITTSSVGMEVIMHNKPMYQFNGGRLKEYRMSWEDFDCSHLFDSSDSLYQLISDPTTQYSKVKNYPPFIENSFGKLDGNSSKRIRDYITAYPIN